MVVLLVDCECNESYGRHGLPCRPRHAAGEARPSQRTSQRTEEECPAPGEAEARTARTARTTPIRTEAVNHAHNDRRLLMHNDRRRGRAGRSEDDAGLALGCHARCTHRCHPPTRRPEGSCQATLPGAGPSWRRGRRRAVPRHLCWQGYTMDEAGGNALEIQSFGINMRF